MATKVSLCVFCHNQEAYVRQALESAFQQDYSPLEIIVTDDASTDGTFALVNTLAAQYRGPHRVLARRNETGLGLAGSLNQVMELVSGDFIVVAAGDDISYPSRCRTLVEAWERHDRKYHLVHSGFRRIDHLGGPLPLTPAEQQIQAQPGPVVLQRVPPAEGMRSFAPFVYGCTAAWARPIFDIFGPLKSRVVQEDVVMGQRAGLAGGALFLPQQLIDYRLHGANIYHVNFQLQDSGLVRNAREFEQLEAFKLRNLRLKGPIHDNFAADVATAARAGMIDTDIAQSLETLIARQRQHTAAEIGLRSGGFVERVRCLLALRRLDGRLLAREAIRLLPRPLYRQSRILLQSRARRAD